MLLYCCVKNMQGWGSVQEQRIIVRWNIKADNSQCYCAAGEVLLVVSW